ncbi:DUF1501 domain-containing protein [Rhizobacter sp. SG703]|uniref:DUF1501 domain-containing protein n=1 Tax=Rhizobacter sp. SG703 TaxID=2587140 RepID=UPI00144599EF|nr:DUF1501 domain-containing protein [Rhizobacter sp. SG703]NKI95700.1 uncharacterized protein (DUF1501 family) [Rhizobacter sp. SG703]
MTRSSAPLSIDRRRWLLGSGATLAGALGTGTLSNLLLGAKPAYAADYKALVCLFMYGGNDGFNTIVPTDSRYDQYANVRQGLAIPKASLVNLAGINYGLHPSLAALSTAWSDGKLAPVLNLGTLNSPLTKDQYRAAASSSDLLPDNLFSHSDQQILWETGSSDSLTRTGWGGRASETLGTANPVISVAGSTRFGLSSAQTPLVLPGPGATFGAYNLQPKDLTNNASNTARKKAIDSLYAQAQDAALADAYAAAQRNAFSVSDRLAATVAVTPGGTGALAAIDSAFAPLISAGTLKTGLAKQLYQVAKLIAANGTVQGNRQIFFASIDSFDTHANQVTGGAPTTGAHADLLKEVGDALGAFYAAMKNLGMADAVTAFTQSDFGRTFTPNNSNGTDHAWGSNHLVLGGAVKGGASYGTFPTLTLGGPDDVGKDSWELQGRWIPTTSVDQYAATMLGWFGASDAQLATVLPNLKNFGTKKLGFL